jgi:hypothetical protein
MASILKQEDCCKLAWLQFNACHAVLISAKDVPNEDLVQRQLKAVKSEGSQSGFESPRHGSEFRGRNLRHMFVTSE